MKRLVIDCRMINSSGIGTYLQSNIVGLLNHFEVIVLGSSDELKKFEWSKSVKIIHFSAQIYSIKEQLMYPFLIPECEIFWSPHFNIPMLPIRAKKRIVTIHDVFHLHYYSTLSLVKRIYTSIILKSAVILSDRIITVSKFSQNELLKFLTFSGDKIRVIYNAVEGKVFCKGKDSSDRSKLEELGIGQSNYILCVGNIKPHKNIKIIFEVLKRNLIPTDIKLVVVGKITGFLTADNQLFREISLYPSLKERVIFTDYINTTDLITLYSHAKIFVFPSLYEGFGIPPLEAMACKCPVIASDIPSVREICEDAVLYFTPNDPNDLAQKIQRLINDDELKAEMIKTGLKRVSQFSWSKSIQSHTLVFSSL